MTASRSEDPVVPAASKAPAGAAAPGADAHDTAAPGADPSHVEALAAENSLIAERRAKLARLRERGVAFPNDFRPAHQAAALHQHHGFKSREQLAEENVAVTLAGRMMLKRVQGKASFATIQDGSAAGAQGNAPGRIQLWLNREGVGEQVYEEFKHWDLGDIVGVEGVLFKTMRGELSVQCTSIRLLAKSLRPLPDKFHGIADQELRYRQRYVDLIVTPEARDTFVARSRMIAAMREFMNTHGFLEVETPMLHPIPGGAAARPFATHHNALDQQMYLRIAPELYLKRLLVGGFERVYEINRNFRNEGISTRHNPEFTMMEFYAAYTDYRWIMDFTEQVIRAAAISATGSTTISYQGRSIDLGRPFERLTISGAIAKYAPRYAPAQLQDADWLRGELARLGVAVDAPPLSHGGLGALQLALFEEVAEDKLQDPTFIVDYPAEVSPLVRSSDSRPEITERFELFITGREIANGFSELNDPDDQAERFLRQVAAKDAGDEEAMYYDADYIRALEYGMPPAGGCGIGIDRLVMLLTDTPTIRDVVLFPALKRED